MLFSSPTFFAFFAVYYAAHWLVPANYRIFLIICGSTIFYAWWKVEYVWLPYLLAVIAYCGVLWFEAARDPAGRRMRATLTIALLFLPLVFFKYANFLYENVTAVFAGGGRKLTELSLPLGISFVTFTLTAYVVDVYKRNFSPTTPPLTVLGYVLFFPHLIAGPILRPVELIPQLRHPRRAKSLRPTAAIAIFTIGLAKKLVVADQLAPTVNAVYAHPGNPGGPEALLAIYAFSAQIYCDFSGYTDMAIAAAMLLGVRLPNNFFRPYCATSIIDFWRRWHVTLSYWLRDYLYIPLGGNRGGTLYQTRNIMITMTLGGLWHGANWTFVIWGALHGAAVSAVHVARRLGGGWFGAVPRWVVVLVTFHFVALAWVFFRAPGIDAAGRIFAALVFGGWAGAGTYASAHAFEILLLLLFFALHRFDDHRRIRIAAARLRPEILWPGIAALWALAVTVSQGSSAKFIYFDF
jgi:alginate O-acetyltransferase complex protein AlgI